MPGLKSMLKCLPCMPSADMLPQDDPPAQRRESAIQQTSSSASVRSKRLSTQSPPITPTSVQRMTLARWQVESPKFMSAGSSFSLDWHASEQEAEPIEILVPRELSRGNSFKMKKREVEKAEALLLKRPTIPPPELPVNVTVTARWDGDSAPDTGAKKNKPFKNKPRISVDQIRDSIVAQSADRPAEDELAGLVADSSKLSPKSEIATRFELESLDEETTSVYT